MENNAVQPLEPLIDQEKKPGPVGRLNIISDLQLNTHNVQVTVEEAQQETDHLLNELGALICSS